MLFALMYWSGNATLARNSGASGQPGLIVLRIYSAIVVTQAIRSRSSEKGLPFTIDKYEKITRSHRQFGNLTASPWLAVYLRPLATPIITKASEYLVSPVGAPFFDTFTQQLIVQISS